MNLSRSPSIEQYQQKSLQLEARSADLQQQNDELRLERESLLRVASKSVRALKLQQQPPQPEGIWIIQEDEHMMEEVEARARKQTKLEHQAWRWRKMVRFSRPFPGNLPNFSIEKQVQRYAGFVPFASSFPLEIIEHIFRFGDQQSLSRASQASLACLQLLLPKLHSSIEVPNFLGLRRLFGQRSSPTSARLTSSLSLNNIQILEILEPHVPFHQDRFFLFLLPSLFSRLCMTPR